MGIKYGLILETAKQLLSKEFPRRKQSAYYQIVLFTCITLYISYEEREL